MAVNVFVSYARDDVLDDKNLIDEFLKHGKARQRNREIEIFKDTERIDFGDVWKSKIDSAEVVKKNDDITQDQDRNVEATGLTLSEEDALKAQIFGCWSIPLGLPYNENLLVRIKLKLKPDGSVVKTEILDHARMNKPGQGFYKVLAESALRAVRRCDPIKTPSIERYEDWKTLQLNFDPREILR